MIQTTACLLLRLIMMECMSMKLKGTAKRMCTILRFLTSSVFYRRYIMNIINNNINKIKIIVDIIYSSIGNNGVGVVYK